MAKFNVNQGVIRVSDGKYGIVRAREVKSVENYTEIKYLVDFGNGIDNWEVLTRKELKSAPRNEKKLEYAVKKYEVGDGRIVTMVARVDNVVSETSAYNELYDEFRTYKTKGRVLNIGFSIYNGTDEYDEEIGVKFALHRSKVAPFTTMASGFSGEFNNDTVKAIMNAKAKYIISHIDQFYKKNNF